MENPKTLCLTILQVLISAWNRSKCTLYTAPHTHAWYFQFNKHLISSPEFCHLSWFCSVLHARSCLFCVGTAKSKTWLRRSHCTDRHIYTLLHWESSVNRLKTLRFDKWVYITWTHNSISENWLNVPFPLSLCLNRQYHGDFHRAHICIWSNYFFYLKHLNS